MEEPLTIERMRAVPLQYATVVRDPRRVCFLCQWVEIERTARGTYSVGCVNPKCLYGQAGWGIDCSAFSRDPGCDDEPELVDRILASQPRVRC